MANTIYSYQRSIILGKNYYDLDDYKPLDRLRPWLISEIKNNFPDKTFIIEMSQGNCYVNMNDQLTETEETILDAIIQDIKDDIATNGLMG